MAALQNSLRAASPSALAIVRRQTFVQLRACATAAAAQLAAPNGLAPHRRAGDERRQRWGPEYARASAGLPSPWYAMLGLGLAALPVVASAEKAPTEHAEPATGIKYPDVVEVPGVPSKHRFIGCGCRLMTPLKVKAYTIGLYADEAGLRKAARKGGPPGDLALDGSVDKTIRLVMARDVDGTHLAKGFDRSILKRVRTAAKEGKEGGKEALRQFNAFFRGKSLPTGTEVTVSWLTGGKLVLTIGGKLMGTIESEGFCWAFFDMYCGPKAVSSEARDGIRAGLEAFH